MLTYPYGGRDETYRLVGTKRRTRPILIVLVLISIYGRSRIRPKKTFAGRQRGTASLSCQTQTANPTSRPKVVPKGADPGRLVIPCLRPVWTGIESGARLLVRSRHSAKQNCEAFGGNAASIFNLCGNVQTRADVAGAGRIGNGRSSAGPAAGDHNSRGSALTELARICDLGIRAMPARAHTRTRVRATKLCRSGAGAPAAGRPAADDRRLD